MIDIMNPARTYTWFVIPLLLFIVAFSVRMEHLQTYRQNPEYLQPDMDEGYHVQWAQRIIDGDLLPKTAFYRAPLYPYLLALLMKASEQDLHLVRIAQAIIGALTVILIYVLALRFFVWYFALAAGLCASLTFYLVFYSTELLIPVIVVPLNVLFLIAFLAAYKSDRPCLYLLAGGLVGLSALARPNVLIVVPVLIIFLVLKRKQWLRPFLFAGMCFLVILPITIINYRVSSGDFVLIASQGGVNFYIGNNESSDGMKAVVPGQRDDWWGAQNDAVEAAEKSEGRSLKPSEVSSFYYKKAFDWMWHHPLEATVHMFKKTLYFFHGFDIPNDKDLNLVKMFFNSGRVPYIQYSLLSALALLGLFLSFGQRENRDEWLIVNIFGIAYIASFVLFFVCARFRLPVIPVMLLHAILAVRLIIQARGRTLAGLIGGLLVTLMLVNLPVFDKTHSFGRHAVTHAVKYRDQGHYEKAIEFLNRAREFKHPQYVIENELGLVAYFQHDMEKAREHFERSLENKSDFAQAIHNMALLDFNVGDYQKAYDRIITIKPATIIDDASMFSMFVDLNLLLGKHEDLFAFLNQQVLEKSHQRQLLLKADVLLKGQYYENAQFIYSFLYANDYKTPEMLNNFGIVEYKLGNRDRAMLMFTMSNSKESQQNLRNIKEAEESDEVTPD